MALKGSRFESTFATYTVESVLGEGGSGRVLAVTDEGGTKLALKTLLAERVTKEKLKRFRNELSFCRRQVHPAILNVLDYGYTEEDGAKLPFYVMPRYAGTLRTHMSAGIAADAALKTFVRILDGVEAAHLNGVWHRDLKPENLLAGTDPTALVIADFGIAHFAEDLLATAVETRDAGKLANFAYAAPEQRRRGGRVDFSADIFALGLILVELFTGEVPHGKDHKTIASSNASLGYLDGLADEMLRQDPGARPQSIANIKQSLIGRGLEFVANQRLSETSRTVVPATVVESVPEFSFQSFDYQNGNLIIVLDREPPSGWMQFFNNPPEGHSAVMGYGPEAFALRGRELSVRVPEGVVEAVFRHAKDYAWKASKGYTAERVRLAAESERNARRMLEAQVARDEERLRVLSRLNKLA